jgi:hypothetical protein
MLRLYLIRRLSALRRSHEISRRSYWLALVNLFCWWILRSLMVLLFQLWRLLILVGGGGFYFVVSNLHRPWMMLLVWISVFFFFFLLFLYVLHLSHFFLYFIPLFYPIVPYTGSDNGDCGWKNGQFISIKKIHHEFLERPCDIATTFFHMFIFQFLVAMLPLIDSFHFNRGT